MKVKPYSFGLIADVQYSSSNSYPSLGQIGWGPPQSNGTWSLADCDLNYSPMRAPRASLGILKQAVAHWRAEGLPSAVPLGDLLDKTAKREGTVEACLAELKAALAAAPLTYHFVFGNGDADVLGRQRWVDEKFAPRGCSPERLYYSTAPTPGLRLVFLDTYDVSMFGPATAEAAALARRHLDTTNPLWSKNTYGPQRWQEYLTRYAEGAQMDALAAQAWNGQPGEAQMAWLSSQLAAADAAGERVFVFGHCPIHPHTCKPDGLAWNHAALRAALERHACVQAYVAGHDHDGGYACSPAGVHYLVPPAPLECNDQRAELSFGAVRVGEAAWTLEWVGKEPGPGSATLRGGVWPKAQPMPYRTAAMAAAAGGAVGGAAAP